MQHCFDPPTQSTIFIGSPQVLSATPLGVCEKVRPANTESQKHVSKCKDIAEPSLQLSGEAYLKFYN